MTMDIKTFTFPLRGDDRGALVAVEQLKDIPFEIKRIYYIYGTRSGVRRGFHAHKTLDQVLVCVNGFCKVLMDDGEEKKTFILDKPYEGLSVPRHIWHEMFDFSQDAVLLVLASDLYCEDDYLRSYEQFLTFIKGK